MTVGFHAPLPPARTGVADYAAALIGALRQRGSVRVNSRRADVCLYHLGNNQLHREIYALALKHPGVVVLHDAVLQHFLLGSLDEKAYVEEFVYNYGEWNRELAGDLWSGRARSATDWRYFRYAMLRRIAEVSRAVVVHNPVAAKMVATHAPNARVTEIPHLFVPPVLAAPSEVARFRQRWNLGGRTFLFAVLGYLRESKRLVSILRAFEAVRRQVQNAALLVAGEFVSADLARAVAPLLAQPGILRAHRTPERIFWRFASAADACINLRYPTAGETSGITIRLMGIGKPVIVTDSGETARFPEAACLRVGTGVGEVTALTEYMIWLAQSPEAGREIGHRAQSHIREHHSLDGVADSYWEVLSAYRD